MKHETQSNFTHQPFLTDVKEIRKRARMHMERGPVTESYGADVKTVVKILNEALATEIVCTLRYRHHYYAAKGIHSRSVAEEFLEHANEEQSHADWIADRICQLGGDPEMNPDGLLSRSHAEYSGTAPGTSLQEMIIEDLYAERVAIESYGEIVRYLGTSDPTTRRLMERILAVEEEHADDLADMLTNLDRERKWEGTAA